MPLEIEVEVHPHTVGGVGVGVGVSSVGGLGVLVGPAQTVSSLTEDQATDPCVPFRLLHPTST